MAKGFRSLVEFRKFDEGKSKPHKGKESGDCGKKGNVTLKFDNKKKGGYKFKKSETRGKDRPPIKCFLCDSPHRARECPKRNNLSAIMEDKDASAKEGHKASIFFSKSLQIVIAMDRQGPPKEKRGPIVC